MAKPRGHRGALLLICAATLLAVTRSRGAEALQPVIARFEMMFSVVSHVPHHSDRVVFYNNFGNPKGVQNYVIPYLVYEPKILLYNPHNVELRLNRARLRFSDPPVGFTFKKNGVYLRPEWGTGEYHGIARLNIGNESNANARKTFTMVMGGGDSANYAGEIVLQPGESRTFASRVETNWTWALETAGGYHPRSFADWYTERDFTNKDGRTNNAMGFEAIAGTIPGAYDPRAGFQTDHLANRTTRPAATLYSFESDSTGWVAIKHADTFGVSATVLRVHPAAAGVPDFQLSQLRGNTPDPALDVLRTYDFSAAAVTQPASPISRTFRVGDTLQQASDLTPGGKSLFSNLVITARHSALRSGAFLTTAAVPAESLYETRFEEKVDFHWGSDGSPSDYPRSGVEAFRVERTGDHVMIDFAAPPRRGSWTIRGGTDPGGAFPDDLNSFTTVIEGPPGTGIYKAKIDVSGRGPRYFVTIGD
jgi:hypothetical protein